MTGLPATSYHHQQSSPASVVVAPSPVHCTDSEEGDYMNNRTPTDVSGELHDAFGKKAETSNQIDDQAPPRIFVPARPSSSSDALATAEEKSNQGQSSSGGGTPNTKQRKYERKTKRFIWPDELHRLFVAAIFDVGLKNASPKALLGLMGAAGPNAGLTTEHLKSHLQKYRLNYERSRMEFLEYYDHSAKKNLKRRRKNALKSSGDHHNTMFVFPILPKPKKKDNGGGDSDSDNDSDDEAEDDNMSGDTAAREKTQRTGTHGNAAVLDRSGSFSQLLQSGKDQQMSTDYARQNHQQQQRILGSASTIASDRVGYGGAAGSAAMQMYAAAGGYRKQPNGAPGNEVINSRAMAAAAAAAAAYRYPLGLPISGGNSAGSATPVGALGELSDPQWNILSSLMSPHIVGLSGAIPSGMLPPGSEAGGPSEAFSLQQEPSDLQLQMHMAMQAQMNLHRQMLTRKVEVSHLSTNSSSGEIHNTVTYGQNWGAHHPQHHQQQQQQQQQQSLHVQRQQYLQQQRAAQQSSAQNVQMQMSSASPHHTMNPQAPARPSLLARSSSAPPASMAAAVNTSGGTVQVNATPTAQSKPPVSAANPSSSGSVSSNADVTMLLPESGGSANFAFNEANEAANVPANLAIDAKAEDDSLDLYRWDRIDLNVELDDDDLFGFLKS